MFAALSSTSLPLSSPPGQGSDAQSSDSFPLLYETVFIPWDIWTEKSDLESGRMSLMSPLSSLLCKAVFVLRDL